MSTHVVPRQGTIDRASLLERHSPHVTAVDPRSPLQVGNGEFAFTADITGLQTFPEAYPVRDGDGHGTAAGRIIGTLLGTMAQWGWHCVPFDSLPGVAPGTPAPRIEVALRDYDTPRGPVPYVDLRQEQWGGVTGEPDMREEWLRNNPHRLDLGRVSLWLARGLTVADVVDADQRLDLATGVLTSRFTVRGSRYTVTTAVHPGRDALAVRIERSGHAEHGEAEHFGIELAFPYGSQEWGNSQDWSRPEAHTSRVISDAHGVVVERVLDETTYTAAVTLAGEPTVEETGPHRVRIVAVADVLDAVLHFSPGLPGTGTASDDAPLTTGAVIEAATAWWHRFWHEGAAVTFEAEDPRAAELERRVVLSQYLIAINSAGSTPPAETGLMLNSWRGKFHLEMHWWHAACLPLWGRPELLERSLAWYETILGPARETAARQGYAGARWPKQTDPSGRETPSSIGTFLIWQQPHPIHLAELVRRARAHAPGDTTVLRRWATLVRETADFMAAFPVRSDDGAFHLAGPLVPAQESYARDRADVQDPTFELAYWVWALRTAISWVEALGEEVPARWREVADGLWKPQPRDGVYPAIAVEPYTIRTDHPSMLAALGVVPETGMIDHAVMAATLADVVGPHGIAPGAPADPDAWDWESTWGWDYPVGAMTAARLGRPEDAVDWLMLERGKNEYLANGHNYQTPALPIYLPGNGGLLTAVALMAGGWDGAPDRPAPGFPEGWTVRHEGLVPLP